MNQILKALEAINPYAGAIIIVLGLILVAFLIVLFSLNNQIKQLKRRYATLTRGADGTDWSAILERLTEEAEDNGAILKDQQENLTNVNKRLNASLNRISIVHYNAFDFTYGDLSFSMAVLDDVGNGFIFTNIHNRDDARCYCKRVMGGESKHPLSEEEKEVLEHALNGTPVYSRTTKDN